MNDNFARRKLFATFFSTFLTSIILGFYSVWDEGGGSSHFFLSTFIYFFFSGLVIGIYGNAVSASLEYVFTKKLNRGNFSIILYILLHGLFGGLIGLISLTHGDPDSLSLVLIGGLPAIMFAISDVWLAKKIKQEKLPEIFPLLVLLGLFFSIALVTAVYDQDINPLTAEEAINYTNAPPILNRFPTKEGTKTERIEGYIVTRKTTANKQKDNTYIVTLKETWQRGNESGYWYSIYDVDKLGATPVKEDGILLFQDAQ